MLSDFDQIYLINLKKRPDRLAKWTSDNNKIVEHLSNFQTFEGIDGEICINENWSFSKGALGCLESHLNIIIDAQKNHYSKIIVFEDDFIFDQNFIEKFSKGYSELPHNWHLLYLFSTDYNQPISFSENLSQCTASMGTVAYCLNSSIYDTLINLLKLRIKQVDVVYAHSHYLINAYKFKENICHHYDGYSDVINQMTTYHKKEGFLIKIKYWLKKLLYTL